ncbi:MAG: adenylate/guanylate cyclase domain-containing protein, partial [Bdellovibrionota bacterium]
MAAASALKKPIRWVSLGLIFAIALNLYKGTMLDRLSEGALRSLGPRHQKVLSLFQASFYFFYDDQFLPGIRQNLAESSPRIERITVLSSGGTILFDSKDPPKSPSSPDATKPFTQKQVLQKLSAPAPTVFLDGFQVQVLVPSGQYGVLYTFDASAIRNRILLILALALAAALGIRYAAAHRYSRTLARGAEVFWQRIWGVRIKFILTIVLVNVFTALIMFFTLSTLQTREQTKRIERESVLFGQFSTAQVISDFTNFFYFYYTDHFLPGIKKIIASNENLVGIRIISQRTGAVLIDSEQASATALPMQTSETIKAEFPAEIEAELRARDSATRPLLRDGDHLLSVINVYRNENQEPLFRVEYLFNFQTLAQSLSSIRSQILLDLVPSLALGLLVAIFFTQLLISPIKRLVRALQRVTSGDYDVTVDTAIRRDEIGELMTAFNSMTNELRKKRELRKYLSDSVYRQVMKAPDTSDGGQRLGGTRVSATVLFSDIRNFVAHCEAMDAEEITSLLNDYFSEMVEVVYKYGGEVDKFIGDAMMAVFYAQDDAKTIRPGDQISGPSPESTALQAIYCGLEMRERLAEFNQKRIAAHKSAIEIGVGITFGEVVSGPIGTKDRMDFTVIGDVVNLANRIEKLSKQGKHTKIVFSHHVEEKVRGLLTYEEMSAEKIRGKEEEVRVFELIGIRDLETLVMNFKSRDTALRRRSVELLGHSRNSRALPYVLAALKSDDEGTRLQAVLAAAKLAGRDDPDAMDALLERLDKEASAKVQSTIIMALGRICTNERILDIASFLDSADERIVANTIEALGQV